MLKGVRSKQDDANDTYCDLVIHEKLRAEPDAAGIELSSLRLNRPEERQPQPWNRLMPRTMIFGRKLEMPVLASYLFRRMPNLNPP